MKTICQTGNKGATRGNIFLTTRGYVNDFICFVLLLAARPTSPKTRSNNTFRPLNGLKLLGLSAVLQLHTAA